LLWAATTQPDKLVLYAPSDGFFPIWGQIFQGNLKQIGIDVEVKYFSFGEVSRRAGIRDEPFDVAVLTLVC
jgi:hypothetical protein